MVVSLHLESVCQTTTIQTLTKRFTFAACSSFASIILLKPFMLEFNFDLNRQM